MPFQAYHGKQQPVLPKSDHDVRHRPVPGPGTYDIHGLTNHRKIHSSISNEPNYSMGKANREAYLKEFIDNEMQTKIPNHITKRCPYYLNDDKEGIMRKQTKSRHINSPRFAFPLSNREDIEKTYISEELASKMPNRTTKNVNYIQQISSIEQPVESTIKRSPRLKFEKSDRYEYEKTFISEDHQKRLPNIVTKECDYAYKPSMGKMIESRRRTNAAHSFGTSSRRQRQMLYLDTNLGGKLLY